VWLQRGLDEADACLIAAAPDLLTACEYGGPDDLDPVDGPELLLVAAKILRNRNLTTRYNEAALAVCLEKKADRERAAIAKAREEER
jgi:hypothetical protein